MAFSDLLMAFCSLKWVCENALTGLVWKSLAPRLQALHSCSYFTVHIVLVSVVQGLDQQTILVCPLTKTTFRGGGVACEQAFCLAQGETESREQGFVYPFPKQRACSQASGGVAKCWPFTQAT